jgi:hypothetical protein
VTRSGIERDPGYPETSLAPVSLPHLSHGGLVPPLVRVDHRVLNEVSPNGQHILSDRLVDVGEMQQGEVAGFRSVPPSEKKIGDLPRRAGCRCAGSRSVGKQATKRVAHIVE